MKLFRIKQRFLSRRQLKKQLDLPSFTKQKKKFSLWSVLTSRPVKVIGASLFLTGGFVTYQTFYNRKIDLFYQKTDKNRELVELVPELTNTYNVTKYIPCALVEEINNRFMLKKRPDYTLEQIFLEDGDCLDLEWLDVHPGHKEKDLEADSKNKIAIVLGCINGSNNDAYSSALVKELWENGYRPLLSHYRHSRFGPNRPEPVTPQSFTDVEDVSRVVEHVRRRYPDAPLYLVGLSMGSNMWIRWLEKYQVSFKGLSGRVVLFLFYAYF